MEIERSYSQAKHSIIFPLIFSNCELNNEFVDENIIGQETDDKKARPLCIKCHTKGRKLVIFGRKQAKKLKRKSVEIIMYFQQFLVIKKQN